MKNQTREEEFRSAISIELEVEQARQVFEYLKYLLSISSGSLVITSAFISKKFDDPCLPHFLSSALICFLASILFSMVCYSLRIYNFPGIVKKEKQIGASLFGILIILTWVALFSGLLLTSVFIIKNIS